MRIAVVCPCLVIVVVIVQGLAQPAQAGSKGELQIYGYDQGDYTYDGNRVDQAWEDALRPTKITTTSGTFGSNCQSDFSAKLIRAVVSCDVPVNDMLGSIKF